MLCMINCGITCAHTTGSHGSPATRLYSMLVLLFNFVDVRS
uniref:Uncharacterized protein n=1 Tax=Arundo donax TaxID=35708 RepID=A0A0A9FPM8_ARUDO